MQIQEAIRIFENRILTLNQQKTIAANIGDIEKVMQIEQELEETIFTLNKLKS